MLVFPETSQIIYSSSFANPVTISTQQQNARLFEPSKRSVVTSPSTPRRRRRTLWDASRNSGYQTEIPFRCAQATGHRIHFETTELVIIPDSLAPNGSEHPKFCSTQRLSDKRTQACTRLWWTLSTGSTSTCERACSLTSCSVAAARFVAVCPDLSAFQVYNSQSLMIPSPCRVR